MTESGMTQMNLISSRPFLLWTRAADFEASTLHPRNAFWPVPLGFTFVLLNESYFMYILVEPEREDIERWKSMIRHALRAGIMIALFASASPAADINGRWEGTIAGPNGDLKLAFNFKVDGTKLTGTVETPNGNAPFDDGKVDGDHISFKTHFGDSEINHEGTISGDTIQLKVEGPWGKSEMTLKRAKEQKSSLRSAPYERSARFS
jgi:hypothetical protein